MLAGWEACTLEQADAEGRGLTPEIVDCKGRYPSGYPVVAVLTQVKLRSLLALLLHTTAAPVT